MDINLDCNKVDQYKVHQYKADQNKKESLEMIVQGRDLPWLLGQWVKRQPDKVFLIWAATEQSNQAESSDRQWTYAQFDIAVRRVATGLQSLGLKKDQRLLIHMENSPEFLITYFACALLGVVSVITNTRSVARELKQSIALTQVAGIVTQDSFLPLFDELDAELGAEIDNPLFIVSSATPGESLCAKSKKSTADQPASGSAAPVAPRPIRFNDLLEHDPFNELRKPDPHRDLRVQFTSGTTSQPKAVLSTHANALFAAQQTALGYGLTSNDVCQVFVPLFHTNGLSTLVTSTLWVGGTVLLQRKFSASNFWRPALTYGATWTCLPGAFFIHALQQHPVPAHRFRFWIANCSPEVARNFAITVRGHWGMTEMVTLPILDDPHHPSPVGSIGRPAASIEVAVRNQTGQACQAGEVGALFVRGCRGISLFKEYLNNPQATANSFDAEGWFITGDRVRIDADGYLFFQDREKDLLRVGGENVAASEIEAVIRQSGWVAECAVVGQKHPMLDEVPVAFVIPTADAPTDLKEKLIDHCKQQLADFKQIRDVHIVDDFPRATLQKIAKYKLSEQLAAYVGG